MTQNGDVATQMRRFFQSLDRNERRHPTSVAAAYGSYLLDKRRVSLIDEKAASRSRFHVGLSARQRDFHNLTKRATLISDTFVLTDHASMPRRRDGGTSYNPGPEWMRVPEWGWNREPNPTLRAIRRFRFRSCLDALKTPPPDAWRTSAYYSRMHCADPEGLGQWIIDAEPLLTAGLAWYLPTYVIGMDDPFPALMGGTMRPTAIDYLVKDGRVVDVSGAEPLKSQLVRPILRIDLPFIDGVQLSQFGRITVDEFDSYRGFRDFLRRSLLDLDDALNDVQSERALMKIGLEIADQIRSVQAEMNRVRRKRAVAVSGTTIGATGVMLAAVYGPAFQQAIAAIGATGGLWGFVHALADTGPRHLRDDKWYYAWALSRP